MDTHCKAECITELAAPSLSRRDETFRATILERNIENSSDNAEFANFLNPQITNEALKLRASKNNMDERLLRILFFSCNILFNSKIVFLQLLTSRNARRHYL